MSQFHDIGRYRFSSNDRLFFDANIWISLFDCRTDFHQTESSALATKIYQGALKRALNAGSQLFTHPIVLSEYVNRMLRDEHNFQIHLGAASKDFKIWRSSSEYRTFTAFVAAQTRAFVQNCTFAKYNFNSESFDKCLLAFEEDSRDLNDELLLELCERCDFKLVTHDGDFQHANVPVLTSNRKYL